MSGSIWQRSILKLFCFSLGVWQSFSLLLCFLSLSLSLSLSGYQKHYFLIEGLLNNDLNASDFFLLAPQPPVGQGLFIHEVSRPHTTTHHSRLDSSGRVISSSQRSLPENTQHSQQRNNHAPGWIRTHNLSRRAVPDLRLRQRGQWDRRMHPIT